MTTTAKLWILRLVSIPAALLFPVVCLLIVTVLAQRVWGNEFPMFETAIALILSGITALCISVKTVFAPRNAPLKQGYNALAATVAFEILAPFALWLFLLPGKPYDRKDLQFDVMAPVSIDVTGTWDGSWTDPRKNFTEAITLTLLQSGHSVTGAISDAKGMKWLIVEGAVSGDRVNLFYDREFAFRSRGATLLGTLKDGLLTGDYYAHDSPKFGWSAKGAWQAARRGL
jgi:hypothetical protein